ncbi:MAG: division/cell wall cluster transcriptional repressor MraZ [Firmicutes bacterium]|nr:division/cell wall cluster transcriptional repressor MraZ [Bacillota bacterium]
MLLGEYKYSVDAKGRLFVPAPMRDEMGELVVISRSFDKCINVYSKDKWAEFLAKFDSLPMTKARDFKRYLCAYAFEAVPDAQGRIVVAPSLREHAGLEKEALVIGVDDHAEIWKPSEFESYCGNLESSDMISKLTELGF